MRRPWLIAALVVAGIPVLYLMLSVFLMAIPANRLWREPLAGTAIYVSTNGAHADIILPIQELDPTLRQQLTTDALFSSADNTNYVAFGWGDRAIYLETLTWSDLTMTNAFRALFLPSDSALHVTLVTEPQHMSTGRRLVLDDKQFRTLQKYIEGSFAHDRAGKSIPIRGANYADNDVFFEATRSYTVINTCNSWAGTALKRAGVRVGHWTPFEFNLLYYL